MAETDAAMLTQYTDVTVARAVQGKEVLANQIEVTALDGGASSTERCG